MRNRIDNILLGLLWLLASTLGLSFWLNTKFGFNIFSAQHWQYLGYMQASRTPVRPLFYFSIIIGLIIMISGLYVLVRPRIRKIKWPIGYFSKRNHKKTNTSQNTDASTVEILPVEPAPAPKPEKAPSTITAKRPPRLTQTPTINTYKSAPAAPTSRIVTSTPQNNTPQYVDEMQKIFEDAGYTIKSNAKIGNVQTSLFAIGANETLWMGATQVATSDMRNAINRLQTVFRDTLESTEIFVNGFVLNAPDAATSEFQDILMFDSIDQLAEYMMAHKNPPITPDQTEDFDAYSAYIGTVIEYIGKI